MTDSKIPGLLAKLEKLDHETYAAWDDTFEEIYDIPYGPLNWESFGKTPVHLLQGVIQDAIAANDNFIGFEITYTSYFDVKYEAEIFWDQTGEILRGFGETAAEAILEAYVNALEAMR